MNSNWSYSPETLNSGQNRRFFLSCMTLKFDGWHWKTIGHLFYTTSSLCIISNPWVNWNWSYSPQTLNLGQIRRYLEPCHLEIRRMTLKNNRATLLCCFKLCASFHRHQWIQTGVTVWKRPILVKMDDFFSRVTYKFYGWPSKTIGHLFCATSSFVYHFVPIGEFKLELMSGNVQFGSNSTIFFSRVTYKFNGWPSQTIGHLFCATASFVYHFVPIGEFELEL